MRELTDHETLQHQICATFFTAITPIYMINCAASIWSFFTIEQYLYLPMLIFLISITLCFYLTLFSVSVTKTWKSLVSRFSDKFDLFQSYVGNNYYATYIIMFIAFIEFQVKGKNGCHWGAIKYIITVYVLNILTY